MKRLIATLLIVLTTLFAVPGGAYPQVEGVVPMIGPDGTAYCTAFVINQKHQYLMTADHCMDAQFLPVVDGSVANEIFHVPAFDVAILHAPGLQTHRKALKFRVIVEAEEKAVFYGYGQGLLTIIEGNVVFPIIRVNDGFTAYTIAFPAIIAGMSGGPVIAHSDGAVIGMNQRSHGARNLSLFASFYQIVNETKAYWESE